MEDPYAQVPEEEAVTDLFDRIPPSHAFDGETYDPIDDYDRLGKQMQRMIALMMDGDWYTLRMLADLVGGSEAGVSARIRDLRKRRFGCQTIERKRRAGGLYVYRWNREEKQ